MDSAIAVDSVTVVSPRIDPERVHRLFNPTSIALIGATDKSWWSVSTFENLTNHSFAGGVHLVNRRGGLVHGRPAVGRIADLPDGIDLAYVMVPADAILEVLAALADRGIRNVVILTAGFGETGNEGQLLERAVREFATLNDMTILGPNGNGFVNAANDVVAYGLPVATPLLRGPVGVVLQSGGIASSVLDFAQSRAIGISLLVSMGNELMLSMTDVVRYLINDSATRVITLFIESIRDPEEFLDVARAALAAGKPIVALKVGRSQMGARVAMAHTGSLVGNDAVIDAVFRQNGIVRVDTLEDLIITSGLLARHAPLTGRRVGFVTPSGGACEIIADRAEQERIEIPEFANTTVDRLRDALPDFAAARNPIDVTGYVLVQPDIMSTALGIAQTDPNTDLTVLAYNLPQHAPEGDAAETLDEYSQLAEAISSSPKPVVIVSDTLSEITNYGRSVAERTGFPIVLGGLDHAMTAIGHAAEWSDAYHAKQTNLTSSRVARSLTPPTDVAPTWSEYRAAQFLSDHGIPVVPNALVTDQDAAVQAAELHGYPVVLKLAADIEHKSDIGGVRLNLNDADAVREAFNQVVTSGQQTGANVLGALVQPQRSAGIELLVGIVTDPMWGHVLAIGLGGIWVEVLGDTALRVLPVNKEQVLEALDELRGISLLKGARGAESVNLDLLADVVVSVADLVAAYGTEIESLEINPLLVNGSRIEALDALISWSRR
uniref:acetate--CoA ligase family protein n=1 Tax=Rhodococcus qingshengii TaxID=334542 RepID=UPI001C4DF21A|nr:acetate--CoA ligase family protein [Rhodococcus qingshengii]